MIEAHRRHSRHKGQDEADSLLWDKLLKLAPEHAEDEFQRILHIIEGGVPPDRQPAFGPPGDDLDDL